MFRKITPFEKKCGLRLVFYNTRVGWGLYMRIRPGDWLRAFWGHPEADCIWYQIGPFAFFTSGR